MPNLYQSISGSVTGTPVVVDLSKNAAPYSVTLIPGSGNTSKVEYSVSPNAGTSPGSANWISWPSGTVSAITNDVYAGKLTALRFTRVSGSSTDTYEVMS